jgi:hypothetical protein
MNLAKLGTEIFNNEGEEVAPVSDGENNPLCITHAWTTNENVEGTVND